jgi:AcrR family transcriptional regulator
MRRSLTIPPAASKGARSTSDESAAADPRAQQKSRTQRALIDAALALRWEGATPTLTEIAERAGVSRATAYRYFASADAVLAMAAFDARVADAETLLAREKSAERAAGAAALAINALFLDDELALHAMIKGFMQVWMDNSERERPARPGRRFAVIEPIIAAIEPPLSALQRKKLRAALSMVIGTEAVIALRDVARATPDEAQQVAAWAARALVRAAIDEAAEKRGKTRP